MEKDLVKPAPNKTEILEKYEKLNEELDRRIIEITKRRSGEHKINLRERENE